MKILNVKVKPNSRETKIISQSGDELAIAVAAPAENNKNPLMRVFELLTPHVAINKILIRDNNNKNPLMRVFEL